MVAPLNKQSLKAFQQSAAQTLTRLNATGQVEVLTVNGRPRAVLLSPEAFDQLSRDAQVTRDVEAIGKSMAEIDAGKGIEASVAFAGLRSKLESIKAAKRRRARR